MRRWWRVRVWILAGLALGVLLGTLPAAAQRTCGAEFSDPASSALRAELVLEGKVRTMHKASEKSPFYNVTVQVRKVHKGGELINGGKKPKRLTVGIFGPEDPVQCVTQVTMGKTYFFFLKRPEGKVLEIMAFPEVRDKKTSRTVRKILCRNCAKAPKLRGKFKPQQVELGKKVKVRCRARGKPDVVYEWLKDGNPLPRKKTIKVRKNKRGSTLEIRRAALDDSGTYSCVARNQVGSDTAEFQLSVFKTGGMQYPACEQQTLCFNGGTCRHISALNMPVCECSQQFQGKRCEERRPEGIEEASLVKERTYIIVGIVIALVVFIIICIASYFLARRQRKKFEARRKRKNSNIPENKPLLDEVDARGGPPPPNLRGLMRNQETQTEELIGNHVSPYPRDVVVPVDENVEAVLRPKSNLEVNGHEPRPLSARSRLKAESQDESPPEKLRHFDLPNGLEPATLATRPEHIELQILNTRAPLQGLSPSTPRSPSDLAQPVVSGGCDAEDISPPDDSLLATWAHSPGLTPVGSTPGITPGGTPKNTPEEESGSGSPGLEGLPPYLINGPLPPPAPALYDSSSEGEEDDSGQLTPLHISEDDLRLSEAELRRLSSLSNDHSAVMSGQGGPWSSGSTPASQSSPSKLGLGADSGYQPSYPSQIGGGGSGGPGGSLGSDRTPPDLGSPSEGGSSSDSAVRSPSEPDLCWDEHGSSVSSRHPYQPFPPGQDDLEDKVTYSAPDPQPFPRSASLQERLRDVREDQDPIPV